MSRKSAAWPVISLARANFAGASVLMSIPTTCPAPRRSASIAKDPSLVPMSRTDAPAKDSGNPSASTLRRRYSLDRLPGVLIPSTSGIVWYHSWAAIRSRIRSRSMQHYAQPGTTRKATTSRPPQQRDAAAGLGQRGPGQGQRDDVLDQCERRRVASPPSLMQAASLRNSRLSCRRCLHAGPESSCPQERPSWSCR
jgi:hypothetical protein